MARRCVFCDQSGPLTEEHAVPGWVAKHLPGEGAFTHTRQAGGEWTTTALDLTVEMVCEDCNGGWMETLEREVRPLVQGPIAGEISAWTPDEQRRVATWMVKTAFMLDLASGGQRPPEDHFHFLWKHGEPPARNCHVWATTVVSASGSDVFRAGWIQPAWLYFKGVSSGTQVDGYVLTANVGHLAFQVLGYVGSEHLDLREAPLVIRAVGDVLAESYNLKIWEPRGVPVSWPPPFGFDTDGLIAYAGRWAPGGETAIRAL